MDYNYTYGKGLDQQAAYRNTRQNLGVNLITGLSQVLTGTINKTTAELNKAKELVGNTVLPGANLGTIAYGSSQAPAFNNTLGNLNYLNLFS